MLKDDYPNGGKMRNNVSFRHPAEFVPMSEQDGILGIDGAQWFVSLLRKIPNLQINEELCQEDWGVVVFAKRNNKRFWIGLSQWELDNEWLAHIHHGSFAWWQKICFSGKTEFNRLALDLHEVLVSEPVVSKIMWYHENEMKSPNPQGNPSPNDGI